ncbi:hypothetical protein [Aeromonas sp. MdU4]|uniref:hypothetical protein n=1 Tax=Aeromonas sp. MdU4 TaxID=3342819 RepID=UPI0035B75E10
MKKYYLCVLPKEPVFFIQDDVDNEIWSSNISGIMEYLKNKQISPYSIIKSYQYKFQLARTDEEFTYCNINLHYCGAVSIEIPKEKQNDICQNAWFKQDWVVASYHIIKGFFINILNILPTESLSTSGYCDESIIICKDESVYQKKFHSQKGQAITNFISACELYVNTPVEEKTFKHYAIQFIGTKRISISEVDKNIEKYIEMTVATQSFFIPLNRNLAITYAQLGIKFTFIFYAWKAIEELTQLIYKKHLQTDPPHKIDKILKRLIKYNVISKQLYAHLNKVRIHRNNLIHEPSTSFMSINNETQMETVDLLRYIDDLISLLNKKIEINFNVNRKEFTKELKQFLKYAPNNNDYENLQTWENLKKAISEELKKAENNTSALHQLYGNTAYELWINQLENTK